MPLTMIVTRDVEMRYGVALIVTSQPFRGPLSGDPARLGVPARVPGSVVAPHQSKSPE